MAGFEPAASSSRTSGAPGRLAVVQLAECAAGRARWRLCRDVAVLPCCTAYLITYAPDTVPTRRPSVFQVGHIHMAPILRESCAIVGRCRLPVVCCCHGCCQPCQWASADLRVAGVTRCALIARRLPAVTAGSSGEPTVAVTTSPARPGGDDVFAQLRRCAGDRDRPGEAACPGRPMAGAGMPGHPRPLLAAAVTVRRNASPARRRPAPHRWPK